MAAMGPGGLPDGPWRRRMRERMSQQAGTPVPDDMPEGVLEVNGLRRTYRLAPGSSGRAPLLLALHGAGGSGLGMAALTGLAARGPAAGFAVAFPDGWNRVWNDRRNAPALARWEAVDDVAFLRALIERLDHDGVADAGRVASVGISNGAFLTEHIARHGLLPLSAAVLVAGSATAVSRQAVPRPARPTSVTVFAGTADPLVPYAGGPIGALGRLVSRRPAPPGAPRRGVAVAVERVVTDWVEANGLPASPASEPVAVAPGDPRVTRLSWRAAGHRSVVLYRIEGGGHTWPGGGHYMPASVIGAVARGLDATGLLLEAVRSG